MDYINICCYDESEFKGYLNDVEQMYSKHKTPLVVSINLMWTTSEDGDNVQVGSEVSPTNSYKEFLECTFKSIENNFLGWEEELIEKLQPTIELLKSEYERIK